MNKDIIKEKIEQMWYDTKQGLINIIQWLPIIWKDRDWDHYYLFKVLEFKLSKMKKRFKKYGHTNNSLYIIKQLDECSVILKRLYEENYISEAYKEHDEKWGEIKLQFNESDTSDYYEVFDVRKNVKTDEDKIKEDEESKKCYLNGNRKQKKDLKRLFDIIRDNILTWWD